VLRLSGAERLTGLRAAPGAGVTTALCGHGGLRALDLDLCPRLAPEVFVGFGRIVALKSG
jgi:hypothetical protein